MAEFNKILLSAKETAKYIGLGYTQFLKLYHAGDKSIPQPRVKNGETFMRWSIYDIELFYGRPAPEIGCRADD